MILKALVLSAALAGAALFGSQTAANATEITFEGGTPGAAIGTAYTAEGATFYGADYEKCGGGCPAPSSGIFASGGGYTSPFTVYFTSLQNTVGFDNVTNSALVATAYDAAGDAIQNIKSVTRNNIVDLDLAATGISFVTFSFLPGHNDRGFGIDDLTFTGAPEPSVWAFMVLGLGMVGFMLRHETRRGAGVSRLA